MTNSINLKYYEAVLFMIIRQFIKYFEVIIIIMFSHCTFVFLFQHELMSTA